MAMTVASLQAVLDLEDRGFTSGIKQADSRLGSFANSIKSGLGSAVKFGVAGLTTMGIAAVGAGGALLKMGSDAEETASAFNIGFGDQATNARLALNAFADDVNRNSYELQGFAASLQSILVPMGLARDSAANMSVGMSELAVDLASFYNTAEPDALYALRAALVGETEPMRRFGVVLNQAAIEQEALNKGLWDGKGTLDAAAKAQATYNLIMAQTTMAQGDASRTSGSWANQMRGLKSSLDEAGTSIGLSLLPVMTPLLAGMTSAANDAVPKLTARFDEFATKLQTVAGPAMLMIDDALTRMETALGLAPGSLDPLNLAMGAFGATLDAIVIGVQAFSIGMQGLAAAVEAVSNAVKIAIGLLEQFQALSGAKQEAAQQALTVPNPYAGGVPQYNAGSNVPVSVVVQPQAINLDGQQIATVVSKQIGQGAIKQQQMGAYGRTY